MKSYPENVFPYTSLDKFFHFGCITILGCFKKVTFARLHPWMVCMLYYRDTTRNKPLVMVTNGFILFKGLQLGATFPLVIAHCYLEFKLYYFKDPTLSKIRVKKHIFESINLWKVDDLFLPNEIEVLDNFLWMLCDFMVKFAKFDQECYT